MNGEPSDREMFAFYKSDGTLIRKYALSELFSEHEVHCFFRSASSIAWRGHDGSWLDEWQRQLRLIDARDGVLLFSLDSGAVLSHTRGHRRDACTTGTVTVAPVRSK
jgi:hypothetical protein